MSAPVLTLQFVDSIASSPTVLFDLNDRSLTFVTEDGWSAPPPQLQRSSSASSAYDGSRVAQSSYMDREITVTVAIASASQDASATAIQAIGRLLNSDGQWLRLSTGTTNPVFFRTKRAEIDQIAEFNGQADGLRTATLTIPAEPFAYGLPESGSATVANDPTAGTNPMSFVFPTAKGDVASPLVLSMPFAASEVSQPVVASVSTNAAIAQPYYVDASSGAVPSAVAGWTPSNVADAAWIGGSKRRAVKTAGAAEQGLFASLSVAVTSGDYRIFVRALSTVAANVSIFDANSTFVFTPVFRSTFPASATAQWFDLGVARLPRSSPQGSDPFGLVPATSNALSLSVGTDAATGTVDVDGLLLVPVDLDAAGVGRFIRVLGRNTSAAAARLTVDGVNELVSVYGASGPPYATGGSVSSVDGAGFAEVVPGQSNLLTLLRTTYNATGTPADVITLSTVLTWSYYPRYLYVRPATT